MSKYPSITPLDGRPVTGIDSDTLAELVAAAEDVHARTGYVGWYNRRRRTVIWVFGADPSRGGAGEEPVFQRGRYLPLDVERSCRVVRLAKKRMREQDAEIARADRDRRARAEREFRSRADDLAPEFRDRTRFDLRRLLDGRHARPTVLIPGDTR